MKMNNMAKKIAVMFFASMVVFSGTFCALAAPSSLKPNAKDNSDSLIYIKKPSKLYASTTDENYTITATGKNKTLVYVYKKSDVDNNFYKVYNGKKQSCGTIGASGLHTITVELEKGTNNFLVRAEYGNDLVQNVKIDITRLTKSQLDKLDQISSEDAFNLFSLK